MSFSSEKSVDGAGIPCVCLCGLKFKSQVKETCTDHLHNWDTWMYRRRQVHDYLTRKLYRQPGDLVMNSGDTYRSIREEQLILGYAKIETHFDKYRGNPDFWKLPISLKSREPPYKDSEYFKVKYREERNEIPDITYVGKPDVILYETDIVPRTREFNKNWQNSTYRQAIVQRVSERINEIQPHKPDISNLIILGSASPNNVKTESEKPKDSSETKRKSSGIGSRHSRSSSVKKSKEVTRVSLEESKVNLISGPKRFHLKINGHEFTEYSDYAYRENRITVIFEHFSDSMLPCMQTILFENNGKTTLRIYWNKYDKLKIFREYTRSTEIFYPFKFDRNEIVLLPGERKEFRILFQVDHAGNYIEHWEITTRPEIWKDDFKLLILLKGFSFIRNFDLRVQEIKDKLDQMMKNTAIKGILNSVIKGGNYCAPTKVTNSFVYSEQEMFETANWVKRKTRKTFKYIYNATIVDDLKQFYEENRFPEDQKKWDLSIKKLREIARKRDLLAYFENKVKLYETAKMKRQALQENNLDSSRKAVSPKREKEDQKKQNKGVKEVLGSKKNEDEETYYSKLNNIVNKLERPSIYQNTQRKKYMYCYIILKTYFCQMFDRLDCLPKSNLIDDVDSSSLYEETLEAKASNPVIYNNILTTDRLTFEIFEESYILKTKRVPAASHVMAKPKSVLLKSIANSDVKKIHKAYFHKDEIDQKGKSKGSPESKKVSGSVKGQLKSKTQTSMGDDLTGNLIEFEPFTQESYSQIKKPDASVSKLRDNVTPPPDVVDKEKYLLVYTSLCSAVDAIVETIEMSDQNERISSDTLGEIKKCMPLKYETVVEKEESIVSSKSSVSETGSEMSNLQSDYFKFLQKVHWEQNANTQKYFIGEKNTSATKKETDSATDVSTLEDDFKIKIKEKLANVFSLEEFRRKEEPYCLKERAAQTDETYETIFESRHSSYESITSRGDSTESSRNIFYFLRNEDQRDSSATLATYKVE